MRRTARRGRDRRAPVLGRNPSATQYAQKRKQISQKHRQLAKAVGEKKVADFIRQGKPVSQFKTWAQGNLSAQQKERLQGQKKQPKVPVYKGPSEQQILQQYQKRFQKAEQASAAAKQSKQSKTPQSKQQALSKARQYMRGLGQWRPLSPAQIKRELEKAKRERSKKKAGSVEKAAAMRARALQETKLRKEFNKAKKLIAAAEKQAKQARMKAQKEQATKRQAKAASQRVRASDIAWQMQSRKARGQKVEAPKGSVQQSVFQARRGLKAGDWNKARKRASELIKEHNVYERLASQYDLSQPVCRALFADEKRAFHTKLANDLRKGCKVTVLDLLLSGKPPKGGKSGSAKNPVGAKKMKKASKSNWSRRKVGGKVIWYFKGKKATKAQLARKFGKGKAAKKKPSKKPAKKPAKKAPKKTAKKKPAKKAPKKTAKKRTPPSCPAPTASARKAALAKCKSKAKSKKKNPVQGKMATLGQTFSQALAEIKPKSLFDNGKTALSLAAPGAIVDFLTTQVVSPEKRNTIMGWGVQLIAGALVTGASFMLPWTRKWSSMVMVSNMMAIAWRAYFAYSPSLTVPGMPVLLSGLTTDSDATLDGLAVDPGQMARARGTMSGYLGQSRGGGGYLTRSGYLNGCSYRY